MSKRITTNAIFYAIILFMAVTMGAQAQTNQLSSDKFEIIPKTTFDALNKSSLTNYQKINGNNFADWTFVYDDVTGSPLRGFGTPIAIDGYSSVTKENAEEAAYSFLETYAKQLRIDATNLRFQRANLVNKLWYIGFVQQYESFDVLHSEIELRITTDGKVSALGVKYFNNIQVNTKPTISKAAAIQAATVGMDYKEAKGNSVQSSDKLYILPVIEGNAVSYKLVYRAKIKTTDVGGQYFSYIDAHDSKVHWRQSEYHKANTNFEVKARVKPVYPYEDAQILPLTNLKVDLVQDSCFTNTDGDAAIDILANRSMTLGLKGKWAYAMMQKGNGTNTTIKATITPGSTNSYTFDSSNCRSAEACLYYYTNNIHDYFKVLDPSMTVMDFQMPVRIELSGDVNAGSYGDSVEFTGVSTKSGRMYETSAILYHEYGHSVNALLYKELGAQDGMINGSLNEGTADVTAAFLIDDAVLGKGWNKTNENENIRSLLNDNIYPDSLNADTHVNGLIVAGAMWDLKVAVNDIEYMRKLAHFVRYGKPDDEDIGKSYLKYFMEVLIQDDNMGTGDNNLANGTPHATEIIRCFNRHGIGTNLYMSNSINHTAYKNTIDTINSYPLTVSVPFKFLGMKYVDSVQIVYTIGNSTVKNIVSTVLSLDSIYTGNIPNQPTGTIVSYYFNIFSHLDHSMFTYGRINNLALKPFTFLVGYQPVFSDDFETNKNWVFGDNADDASYNTWVRIVPEELQYNGSVALPGSDHSEIGSKCMITGTTNTDPYSFYNNFIDGTTTIISPSINVADKNKLALVFYYWLFNYTYANALGTLDVKLSTNDGYSWFSIFTTEEACYFWNKVIVDLSNYTGNDVTNFQFKIICSPGLFYNHNVSLTKALVDDFEVLEPIPSETAGIDDVTLPYNEIEVYPNPTSDYANVILNGSNIKSVEIVNSLGEQIFNFNVDSKFTTNQQLRWDGLDASGNKAPTGIYFLVVHTDDKTITKKIVLF